MSKGGRAPSRVSKSKNAKKTAPKKGKSDQTDKAASKGAVTLDPFMMKETGTITDYCTPPALDNNIKLEALDSVLLCRWKLGSKGICKENFDSPDELIEHLLDSHARCGTRGYVCCWENCSKRSVSHYNTRNEFKDHLKFHTVISPFSPIEDKSSVDDDDNSSDESYNEKKDKDSTDSDDADSSDEEFLLKKRKRKPSKPQKNQSKPKRICSDSKDSPKPTITKQTIKITPSVAVTAVKTSGNSELTPVALSFYRFTCMWVVRFMMRGKNSTQEQNVICHRKFSIIEDSIEHLIGHHLGRVKDMKEPLKCLWKDCSLENKVFKTIEELEKHVLVHTEEKMLTLNSNLTLHESSLTKPDTSSLAKEATKTDVATTNRKSNTPEKPDNVSKKLDGKAPDASPLLEKENNSWMVSVLRSLLSTKLETGGVALCPAFHACLYCRFCSLKNRFFRSGNSVPLSMFEFTLLKNKFEGCSNNPVKYFQKLLDDFISHEDKFHSGKSVRDSFWVRSINAETRTCSKHTLNQNVVNLFPVQYKSCRECMKLSKSWPTSSHGNLVITLDAGFPTRYPEVLMVKGKVYQLSSVVCEEDVSDGDSYFTYVRVKHMWISYFENSSNVADASKAFSDKGACILIYTEKTADCNILLSNPNAQVYEYGDCKTANSQELDTNRNHNEIKVNGSTAKKETPRTREDGFVALFRCRQLINDGKDSCINAVLQALLQTGLATVVKKLCKSSDRCYFCRMLSFTQRAICSPEGSPIKAFELVLHKEELNIGEEEGNPEVYISDLIGEIISDERAHHNSSDAKSRFTIKLQKESCSCINNCESYHWAVSPTKKNEKLEDLMITCTMQCTQCNIMTKVKPVEMPDNLIVTIEKNESFTDASVHYPDEWAYCNVRYFLASVIVDDPTQKTEHYFTYCKVFGRWMCYDDEKVTKASAFTDVLANKRACVLIYVTKELTSQLLQNALADARCYTYKKRDVRKNLTGVVVKQEPLDEY
ncbi:uncharacterized protein LOC120330733 [Styela clava]